MQKIVPHIWFDKEAVEAAEFYASVFPDSGVTFKTMIKDTPSGDCDIVSFKVMGHNFMAISAGPLFKLNPSISFMINFDPSHMENAREQMDEIWAKLTDGGKVLMPLDAYPFSEHYGWAEDRYGVSWQLILTNPEGEKRQPVIPSLLFTNELSGKAEEATDFYLSVFKNAKRGTLVHYEEDTEVQKKGEVMFTDLTLEGQWLAAMDGGSVHDFGFNEAVSLMINCKDQEEIDYYWGKLSAVPEAEQCGWLKDKYGVSWQVIPENMGELLKKNPEKTNPAMLKMKKIIIADLESAAKA